MNLSEWVDLRGGVSVPLAVIVFAIDLEDRGWELTRMESKLILRPKTQNATKAQQAQHSPEALSETDRSHIQTLKVHLLELVSYLDRPLGIAT